MKVRKDLDLDSAEAVRAARQAGGWVRCTISTCAECHDSACEAESHEVLPIVRIGNDLFVSCERCGAPLHKD